MPSRSWATNEVAGAGASASGCGSGGGAPGRRAPSGSRRWTAGRRDVGTPRAEIMSTIAAAAKNESESMTNAVPVPTTAIAAPAIGGAMIPVSCIVPWRSALPEDSWSLARVRGRNACWAGTNAASAMPNRMPSSASSGIVALWVTTSAAIAPTSTPRARWARDHHRAGRQAVGEHAEGQDEDGARDADRDQHGAQREARLREVEDEPGERDDVEVVADERDGLAPPEQAEVADGERSPHGQAAGAGDGGHGETNPWAAGGWATTRGRSGRRCRRRRRRGPGRGSPSSSPRGRG